MKKYIIASLAITISISACKNNNDQEIYSKRVDSLNYALFSRDSTINDFLASFNEIQQNLDSVATRQNMITMDVKTQKGELNKNVKENINSMIVGINDLMEQNKKRIEELNKKLKNNSWKIGQFQKMIDNLNGEIAQKNIELQSLNDQLIATNAQVAQLQISIDTLTSTNSSQSQMIASQKQTIHTAFYVIGKSKDLENMKVIDKTGGLLGIGKTSKLNSDVDKNNFKQIDYTEVVNIPINSKKAKIVTAHPSDSYIIEKDKEDEYTNLRITEPEKFWSESKYLVVIN